MDVIIKTFDQLTNRELYEILSLRSEVFVVEQTSIYQDVDGKDYDSMHIFIKSDEKIIGYMRAIPKGISFDEASIGRVIMAKNHRKSGLGRQLMNETINYAFNEMNEPIIRIHGQCYLENFYSSLGFKRVSEDFLEDGILHCAMLLERD